MSKCPYHFDLMNPESYAEGVPFDDLKTLRSEHPVAKHEDSTYGVDFWAITKREDLDYVSKNPKLFSAWQNSVIPEEFSEEDLHGVRYLVINMDPPNHVRYRRIVRNAFTPRAVDSYEQRFREIAKGIVDRVASRGECEFVTEVTAELPVVAICELMGIPLEDRAQFSEYVNTMVADDQASPDERAMASAMVFEYAMKMAAAYQENPKDDLVGALLQGLGDGEKLTEEEFCYFFLILIVGGIETTRTVTGQGMRLLIEHPDQLQKLVDDPSLIPGAIEEMLRFNTAFITMRRTATEDVQVNGSEIKAGDKVLMFYHSANRDEEVFEDADVFDVARAQRVPTLYREHRAFGVGQHQCLGAHLARLELKVLFEEIVPRMRNPKFARNVSFLPSFFINGIKEMNITFDVEEAG